MDSLTRRFVRAAEEGRSVFIPEVRDAYREIPENNRLDLHFILTGLDGAARKFAVALPLFAGYPEEERRFVLDFAAAEAFNIVSCLGGRELRLHFSRKGAEADAVLAWVAEAFAKKGHRNAARVADRMLAALFPGEKVRFSIGAAEEMPECRKDVLDPDARAAEVLRDAARGLEGKVLLGIDVGGTDVKLALAVDGRLSCVKEYDWFPTAFTSAEEWIRPLETLVRLMRVAAVSDAGLGEALARKASVETMEAALRGREDGGVLFDAIGLSFPDVVVEDRIVGGETPKTVGMRKALGDRYEEEFAKITRLGETLGRWVKGGRAVHCVNDGAMAAFTAGVEVAQVRKEAVARGVLAYSLGTDFGGGWVTAEGKVPDIPLEMYSCIVDLGSFPEQRFAPEDVRSINNFNHGLPGTMQKFAGQSGVFRMAMKYLPEARADVYGEILEKGFVVERDGAMRVPVGEGDRRKAFLEYMMGLASRGDCGEVEEIFREAGRAIGMISRELDWIVKPGVKTRTLFGRMVKMARCFELMREGAAEVNARTELVAADDNMANTELMRELALGPGHTVAQFAQAVGAVHYANSRLAGR